MFPYHGMLCSAFLSGCHIYSVQGWCISLSEYIITRITNRASHIGMKLLLFVSILPFIICWVKNSSYWSATSWMQPQVQKAGVILFSSLVMEQRSGQPTSMRMSTYHARDSNFAKCSWYENVYSITNESIAQGRECNTKNMVWEGFIKCLIAYQCYSSIIYRLNFMWHFVGFLKL